MIFSADNRPPTTYRTAVGVLNTMASTGTNPEDTIVYQTALQRLRGQLGSDLLAVGVGDPTSFEFGAQYARGRWQSLLKSCRQQAFYWAATSAVPDGDLLPPDVGVFYVTDAVYETGTIAFGQIDPETMAMAVTSTDQAAKEAIHVLAGTFGISPDVVEQS